MRVPNDRKLAENVPEIDLILGGHDHSFYQDVVNQSYILKSGAEFKELTINHLEFLPEGHTCTTEHELGIFVIKNKIKITTKLIKVTKDF